MVIDVQKSQTCPVKLRFFVQKCENFSGRVLKCTKILVTELLKSISHFRKAQKIQLFNLLWKNDAVTGTGMFD